MARSGPRETTRCTGASPSGASRSTRSPRQACLAPRRAAARIAILVAMFLVFVVFAVYFAFLRGDFSASFFRRPREWIGGVVLVIAIPIVLYYVLRLWLEGEVSRYPD